MLFLAFTVGETVADQQQWNFHQWKKAEVEAGREPNPRFLQRGLFQYSRHPNYFFELAQWWVIFLFGVVAARSVLEWTIVGPFLLTLLFVGSTRFTEKISLSHYPEYELFQRSTSAVIPWFTRSVTDRAGAGQLAVTRTKTSKALQYTRIVRPQKIILYYGFTPLNDPDAIRLWQRTLCEQLSLKGRILISRHGINGTLGGDLDDLRRYVAATREFAGFRTIDFKWSEGSARGLPSTSRARARRDRVLRRERRVGRLTNAASSAAACVSRRTTSTISSPQRGEDVVFFDARNAFEAAIGRFKDAVVPDVGATRDFAALLDSGRYDHLKAKAIVTYCTGGVRCEVLSALMRRRGFDEVYQIDGGIVRYGETFGDDGLWEGSLYLFDARMHHEFSDHSKVLGDLRALRRADESVPQLCEPGVSQAHPALREMCAGQRQHELLAAPREFDRRHGRRPRRSAKRLKQQILRRVHRRRISLSGTANC